MLIGIEVKEFFDKVKIKEIISVIPENLKFGRLYSFVFYDLYKDKKVTFLESTFVDNSYLYVHMKQFVIIKNC